MERHEAQIEACVPAFDKNDLEKALAVLGYPGFAYLTRYLNSETDGKNDFSPTELLQWAIVQDVLNTRVTEALFWLVAAYAAKVDWGKLISFAQEQGVQNRLGYLACLALQLVESKQSLSYPEAYRLLQETVSQLRAIRQSQEKTLMNEAMGPVMRSWVQANRAQEAVQWRVLTTITTDDLQHAE